MRKKFEDKENPQDPKAMANFLAEAADDEEHEVEIKCWHYIVFPVWIWKTFIHAKHEAFRFKYFCDSIKEVE